jgi:nitrogen-specific signal transduction histidine kinase
VPKGREDEIAASRTKATQLGDIAHDFNNLLQTILGAAVLLELRADDPSGVRHLARMVIAASEQGARLSHRLLALSQDGGTFAEPSDR